MSRPYEPRRMSSGRERDVAILQKTAGDTERDAKSSAEVLRGLLKAQPPWSREVEAQRQRTRNLYLTLLFAHPLSPHAQSLEPLWQSTTYTLISSYRESVSRAEAAIPPSRKKGGSYKMGDPEYRKNITRFRQALASEEGFYRGLIGRIVGFYQLQDLVLSHLGAVGVPVPPVVEGGGPDEGLAPIVGEDAKDKLGLVYKALICLGDIERYKEQYSDHYRNGKERVRSKAGEEVFGKAMGYYEVARGLLPDDGAAFNQLAVISTYLSDDFNTTYYYFRALAVRSPFRNGEEIFDRFLMKLFERFRSSTPDVEEADEVGKCKKELLAIASIIFRRSGLSQLPKLFGSAIPALQNLLATRQLPSEVIVKLTAIAIGTHWHARHSSSVTNGHTDGKRVRDAETAAVDFVLRLGTALFDVASAELREAASTKESAIVEDESDDTLYSLISAVLRRVLPALRIVSKWLKLNVEYLSRLPSSTTSSAAFWKSYEGAMRHFAGLFPIEALPGLLHPLEEDVDMRGFIPLSRGLHSSNLQANDMDGEEDHVVHPNEEQLMRIADLQVDASLISQLQSGGGRGGAVPPFAAGGMSWIPKARRGTDEDIASVSTQTEDDPVNLAFRAILPEDSLNGDGEEEEDEVILWSPAAIRGTPAAATTTSGAASHAQAQATSAFDLLQNLVLESSTTSARTPPKTGSPHLGQPPSGSPGLLFGGDSSGIWRMTREESEKGAQRSSMAEQQRRESEAKQKEAIKAIWNDPPPAPAPAPPTAMKASTSGGFAGNPMATPKITPPAPAPASAFTPMSGSAWAVNDAASLYAGLSSNWTPPTFTPQSQVHTSSGQAPAGQRAGQPTWLGAAMETPAAPRGYAGQTGNGQGSGYGQWGHAYGPG